MTRILAIALDAAEPSLLERWMEDGSLPNLAALRARGGYGHLASSAEWMTGSAWPTFYTGQNPAQHGFYNYLVWRADKMWTAPPSRHKLALRPFWRALKNPDGPVVIAVDAPLTFGTEPFNGKEIISLATHDSLFPMTGYPPEFVQDVRSRFGEQIMSTERYALQRKHEFRATRDEVVKVARRVSDLCVELIRGEPWDLFFASFASVHRGGHRLWALHNIVDSLSAEDRIELADALHLVYEACDQVVGRLLDAAGPDVTAMVFSLHGMGPNSSKTVLLPEMLRRVMQDVSTDAVRSDSGLLGRIREILPGEFRHRVKSALPVWIRHWLTAFWRMKEMDWSRTRAFSLIADTQGWIRINLKGREALGIVEPGGEYNRLCAQIANGLRTFVDADTSEPIVGNIVRSNQVFEGERLDELPDLIVQWSESPAANLRAVVSPRYGKIDWPTPGQNPEGRSGNHRKEGMLIAAGQGVKSGTINGAHILDLAPTILTMLGQPIPPDMEGRALFNS